MYECSYVCRMNMYVCVWGGGGEGVNGYGSYPITIKLLVFCMFLYGFFFLKLKLSNVTCLDHLIMVQAHCSGHIFQLPVMFVQTSR